MGDAYTNAVYQKDDQALVKKRGMQEGQVHTSWSFPVLASMPSRRRGACTCMGKMQERGDRFHELRSRR